jgi:hypothetical protein
MIDAGILARLSAVTAVSTIVSTRIYNNISAQNAALPYIVFKRISSSRELPHSGAIGLCRARFQFDCVGKTPTLAKQLAGAVRNALHGYSGSVGGETIMKSELVNEVDITLIDFGHAVILDFMISYTES